MIPSRPSRTALRVAICRAVHQLVDRPLVLEDPLAVPILGEETAAQLRADPRSFETNRFDSYLRAVVVARSRLAEDRLGRARAAGVRQYVVLGAGLDTFAYRDPPRGDGLRVWEVDHPATQAWKRELLKAARIAEPPSLTFVPIDFAHESLPDRLARAGFDADAGAVFAWLGVTEYLTRENVLATLKFIARATHEGGGVVFDYAIDAKLLPFAHRLILWSVKRRVAKIGEPWLSSFDPAELARELRSLGFSDIDDHTPDALNARYFAGRTDGLRVGWLGNVMWAGS